MGSELKFPTLLGLGVLLAGLAFGVILMTRTSFLPWQTRATLSFEPKNLTVVNLSATSASILWQTDTETTGFLKAGTDSSLKSTYTDERDEAGPKPHRIHFVTLTNLTPETTYYFRINSGPSPSPATPLSFKTTAQIPPSNLESLVGTVLAPGLTPVNEALVVAEIPGAQTLASVTKMGGSFILPLSEIKTTDLSQTFNLQEGGGNAKLRIFNNEQSSEVSLALPADNSTLPPIILGQSKPFHLKESSLSASPKYDLNGDGSVSALDLSLVFKNFGSAANYPEADLNRDGQIDDKDLAVLNKAILQTPPK